MFLFNNRTFQQFPSLTANTRVFRNVKSILWVKSSICSWYEFNSLQIVNLKVSRIVSISKQGKACGFFYCYIIIVSVRSKGIMNEGINNMKKSLVQLGTLCKAQIINTPLPHQICSFNKTAVMFYLLLFFNHLFPGISRDE